MKPTTRRLLLILALALLNCLLHGAANLAGIILLSLALIPVTRQMDKEERRNGGND